MTAEASLFIVSAEGGYAVDPKDRGGATNYGITTATLKQARKTIPGLPEHVRDLTTEQALKHMKSFTGNRQDAINYPALSTCLCSTTP